MKKILALVGLGAALASCGSLSSDGQLSINTGSVVLTSGYAITGATTYNGRTYNGAVICDNLVTPLQLSFSYRGNINDVTLQLQGSAGKVDPNLNVDRANITNNGSFITIPFYSNPGTVPLSLPKSKVSAQAIIVTPVENPHVIGATRVRMIATSTTGGQTGTLDTNYVAVVDNCPTQ